MPQIYRIKCESMEVVSFRLTENHREPLVSVGKSIPYEHTQHTNTIVNHLISTAAQEKTCGSHQGQRAALMVGTCQSPQTKVHEPVRHNICRSHCSLWKRAHMWFPVVIWSLQVTLAEVTHYSHIRWPYTVSKDHGKRGRSQSEKLRPHQCLLVTHYL